MTDKLEIGSPNRDDLARFLVAIKIKSRKLSLPQRKTKVQVGNLSITVQLVSVFTQLSDLLLFYNSPKICLCLFLIFSIVATKSTKKYTIGLRFIRLCSMKPHQFKANCVQIKQCKS